MSRFLQNNGKPSILTVSSQRFAQYYDKKGNFHQIEVIMKREGNDDKTVEKFRLADDEKCIVYKKNGVYQSRVIKPKEFYFTVESWPHLLNVHVGKSKYDERVYNFRVEEIVKVDDEMDFQELFKKYYLLDEADEKGNIIKKNQYSEKLLNPDETPDYTRTPAPEMEDIPINSSLIRRATPYEQRFWRKDSQGNMQGGLQQGNKDIENK